MLDDELSDFMGRIATALITTILNLFLGFFRDYIFYYIVYINSLFSNSLSQITAISYANLNMFQSIEGVILLGISIISALISLFPAIKFLKWLNEEVSEQDLGLNLILALLIELITLFL
ncbi:hypothetical protein LS215_1724 [Sulfolobus islandicus L.S.2.15]|uniref:Uncharacterized protein n=1 Tax=Saccharolobus islandicus (strain L.S.2.15 / Lassen \|nr:hypothetical protein [Sulfolobus islandicus]ACP35722.1 hypothetical protein LS215_1724 [Sulfolobus islandicus L.S.2.15]